MVISTSLTNRINNVINVELGLMKKKLADLDFEDDYINDLAEIYAYIVNYNSKFVETLKNNLLIL